jgi:hypothetical protein
MAHGRDLLRRYLKDEDLSQAEFARRSNGAFTEGMLSHYLSQDPETYRGPGIGNALVIDKLTHGKVPVPSWVTERQTKGRKRQRGPSKAA